MESCRVILKNGGKKFNATRLWTDVSEDSVAGRHGVVVRLWSI